MPKRSPAKTTTVTGFTRLRRKTAYASVVFNVHSETWRDPDGYQMTRDIIDHPGAVAILPFLSSKRVLMIRQFRAAVGSWIWEIPAGTLEKGEKPLQCARRELIEEVGFAARKWKKLGTFWTAPGFCTEVMHVYRAWDLTPQAGQADDDEHIRVKEMPIDEVHAAARSGRLRDAKSLAALYLHGLAR
jgi:ADP-ribose pyrophosphatase